ncbi:MAG TPA: DUF1801 domain-containing protein [Chitinophagaceae bacterium]|nr:DUF1801 domain-containing protein [Chitinophagaceae bacterium]
MKNTGATYISPKNFDEYLAMQPEELRAMLVPLRSIILSLAPDAVESISYQVPCFKYHYMLVGLGITKDHCSLYTMSPSLVKKMKTELKGVRVSGATLHFSVGAALPVSLIKTIVKARMRENEQKAHAKK